MATKAFAASGLLTCTTTWGAAAPATSGDTITLGAAGTLCIDRTTSIAGLQCGAFNNTLTFQNNATLTVVAPISLVGTGTLTIAPSPRYGEWVSGTVTTTGTVVQKGTN